MSMTTHERILELRKEADAAIKDSSPERVQAAADALAAIDHPDAQHYARQVKGVAAAMVGDYQTSLKLYSEVLQYEIDRDNEDGVVRAKGNLAVMYHSSWRPSSSTSM